MSRMLASGVARIVPNLGVFRGPSYIMTNTPAARTLSTNETTTKTGSCASGPVPYCGPSSNKPVVSKPNHMDKAPSMRRGLPAFNTATCNTATRPMRPSTSCDAKPSCAVEPPQPVKSCVNPPACEASRVKPFDQAAYRIATSAVKVPEPQARAEGTGTPCKEGFFTRVWRRMSSPFRSKKSSEKTEKTEPTK
jgi:hypothetical protein